MIRSDLDFRQDIDGADDVSLARLSQPRLPSLVVSSPLVKPWSMLTRGHQGWV